MKGIIKGILIDEAGRCIHYHKEEDIVALKCYKCKQYYSCYKCHDEQEDHLFLPYPIITNKDDFVAMCGNCFSELNYNEYKSNCKCPYCNSPFNPLCELHDEFYFSKK